MHSRDNRPNRQRNHRAGKDAKIVRSIIQYRLKNNDKGEPDKRKVRFCARGDTYSTGPEVPIFAPTAPWVTVQCFFSMACANNYAIKTFDVKSAFTSVERTGLPDIWLAAPFALGYPFAHAFHVLKNSTASSTARAHSTTRSASSSPPSWVRAVHIRQDTVPQDNRPGNHVHQSLRGRRSGGLGR